ncbi:MAG TPA: 50S ribosomal protein L18 [Porticoccaceae bacterium]|nr:50S ribosomal protein L18 [Porticoccaceae bacterium]
MNDKKQSRLRRARKARSSMRRKGVSRLCVFRTPRHIYAQIIQPTEAGDRVVASASTLDESLRGQGATGNAQAAERVGTLLAERGKQAGVTQVAFDRSGFKYHGRVKALADAARAGGLEF